MAVSVFVSYSHNDVALVTPVVKLLRLNKSLVFQDTDSIELGKKWREQAGRALADARLVVLFLCVSSSHFSEVASEYKSALNTGKDLLPVLLDATPLPAELSEFQWIDFRGTVGANHANGVTITAEPTSTRFNVPASKSVRYSLLATMTVILMVAGLSFWSLRSLKNTAPPTVSAPGDVPAPAPEGVPLPKPPPGLPLLSDELLLGFIVVIAIALGAFFWCRRTRVTARYPKTAADVADESHRQIAARIEAEILRRDVSAG